MNPFKRTFQSLLNTKDKIRDTFQKIGVISKITSEDLNNIEDCLLSADVGWELTEKIIENIKKNKNCSDKWEDVLIKSIESSLPNELELNNHFNKVIVVVGINGTGKTTVCAKLAKYYKDKGKKITLVAADTFRAAAINQLKIWAERIGVNFISNINSSDPASIAYDGANSGLNKKHDYIIIDTAGRLHNSENLMHELEKIHRIINKLTNDITVCMSLDANVGQNGIKQVEMFNKYLPIDNIILNKMDGTAKGGIVLSIFEKLGMPVSFLGVGERMDDIEPFNLTEYLKSLVEE